VDLWAAALRLYAPLPTPAKGPALGREIARVTDDRKPALLDDRFQAKDEKRMVEGRGLVATALGYSLRHETALRRSLEDGRLRMDNNAAERALRPIAVGVSLCTLCSSSRNLERAIVPGNSRRAPGTLATAA